MSPILPMRAQAHLGGLSASSLDQHHGCQCSLSDYLTATGRPYRVPSTEPTALGSLARYWRPMALVALIGILVGLLVFAREGMVEGVPRDLTKVARGAMVYLGLEAAGVLIGFMCLCRSLGLLPAQARTAADASR